MQKSTILKKIPAIVIAGSFILLILDKFNISFEEYNKTASFITLLLIPATISLGFPIYKNFELLKKNKRIIYTAFLVATFVAIFSTYFVAKLFHTELYIIESMLPKSVTAPIAIEISKSSGGIPELTACVVVLTGVFGAMFGHRILKLLGVKNDIAIGLSMGAASHALGTARCIEKGNQKQVVMASVSLVIVGILTAILIPILFRLV